MGKVLAVWSHTRRAGKSVVAYMLARQMAGDGRLRVLICCLNYKCSSLYRLLDVEASATGLEELVNCGISANITDEFFPEIIPFSENLFFLGSYKMTNSYASKNILQYADLFERLKDSFDLILFDAASENENVLSRLILGTADIVIRLYCQDIENIIALQRGRGIWSPTYQQTVNLISQYRNIYPKAIDLRRKLGLDKLFTIEYCAILQEMINRGSLYKYTQMETGFNKSIEKIYRHLMKALEIETCEKDSRNSLIGGIKRFSRLLK